MQTLAIKEKKPTLKEVEELMSNKQLTTSDKTNDSFTAHTKIASNLRGKLEKRQEDNKVEPAREKQIANMKAATRIARTSVTAAESAERLSALERAKVLGIDYKIEWLATLDGRTRHSHRMVDGEQVEVGEKFSNGCRYPGDPDAPYAETANCRCTVVAGFDDADNSWKDEASKRLMGQNYDDWKGERRAAAGLMARGVSSINAQWAKQFPNEVMTIIMESGEKRIIEGNPLSVPITDADLRIMKNATLEHTHTTTIGGTFGQDDIDITVDGWVSKHVVRATITSEEFEITRTPHASKKKAQLLKADFSAQENLAFENIRNNYYDQYRAPKEQPLMAEDYREIEKMVKASNHEWLLANASRYGYRYRKLE